MRSLYSREPEPRLSAALPVLLALAKLTLAAGDNPGHLCPGFPVLLTNITDVQVFQIDRVILHVDHITVRCSRI